MITILEKQFLSGIDVGLSINLNRSKDNWIMKKLIFAILGLFTLSGAEHVEE